MNFNTQVCTNREQSERLLAMGLKKETADMILFKTCDLPNYPFDYAFNQCPCSLINTRYVPMIKGETPYIQAGSIPAWSLHRLMELCPMSIHLDSYADTHYYLRTTPFKVIYQKDDKCWLKITYGGNIYDRMISMIEWLVNNNHLNKEYLEETK